MPCFRSLGVITVLLSFSLAAGWAQRPPLSRPLPNAVEANERTALEVEMQRKSQSERDRKRVKDMKRDSQKLLELASELKKYVDNSGEAILSLEVIRKADEMEKLARQVKNNMRGD